MLNIKFFKNDLLFNLVNGRSTKQFLFASIFSLGFSICVILCTFGLMDGFENVLKLSLRKSSGDLIVTSREGFYQEKELFEILPSQGITAKTSVLNSEGFLLFNEASKGISLKGIDQVSFSQVTSLDVELTHDSVAIGKELASELGIQLNDEIVLVLGKGNEALSEMPLLVRAKVQSIISHGIYEKDLRIIYCDQKYLAELLGTNLKVNQSLLKLVSLEQIDSQLKLLNKNLPYDYIIKPYWSEFSSMLEAVKVEKLSISIVLQLIVIVSIFNIIAFIMYLNERRLKEIFLLKALGFSQNKLVLLWMKLVFVIWVLACVVSVLMTKIFSWMLINLKILKLPPQIYILENFGLQISFESYAIVFSLALAWLILITGILVFKYKSKSIVVELKRGFIS